MIKLDTETNPNPMPNFHELAAGLKKYFSTDLTQGQLSQFEIAFDAYVEWNEKINLVSRKDLENLGIRHFLHSLAIAKAIRFKPGTSVLDVGTGGGFPGIPLAIFFPESTFTLVDSVRKKLHVAEEIASRCGLKNVHFSVQRVEQLEGQWDFVVSRAVADWPEFMPWVEDKVHCRNKNELKNGILYLKGGDAELELSKMKPFGKAFNIWQLSDWFEDEWFETKLLAYLGLC